MKTCESNDLRYNLHYYIMPYASGTHFWKKESEQEKSELRINLGTDTVHIIKQFKVEVLPIKNSSMMQVFKH